jgi:hypothetical protein
MPNNLWIDPLQSAPKMTGIGPRAEQLHLGRDLSKTGAGYWKSIYYFPPPLLTYVPFKVARCTHGTSHPHPIWRSARDAW